MADEARTSEPGRPEEASFPGERVCVRFKGRRLEVFHNDSQLELRPGAFVLVEADRGCDLGEVMEAPPASLSGRRESRLRRVLREATPEEVERRQAIRAEDDASLAVVRERVEHFGLPMHLVDAEHQFDGNRISFFFTADHRVDFRDLVRDLAGIFRTRIELRQIGTREAARRLGGLGPCGRDLCCGSFLWDFERVTLQMARDQNLAINPSRLSGICGRLLCCLTYEECAGRNGRAGAGCSCGGTATDPT
jgi:cell fate regulator YaaT (PSP1 superfamily)